MAVAATEDETGSRRDGRCSSQTQLEMNIFHRESLEKRFTREVKNTIKLLIKNVKKTCNFFNFFLDNYKSVILHKILNNV